MTGDYWIGYIDRQNFDCILKFGMGEQKFNMLLRIIKKASEKKGLCYDDDKVKDCKHFIVPSEFMLTFKNQVGKAIHKAMLELGRKEKVKMLSWDIDKCEYVHNKKKWYAHIHLHGVYMEVK